MITVDEETFLKANPLPPNADDFEYARHKEVANHNNATRLLAKPNNVIPFPRNPTNPRF